MSSLGLYVVFPLLFILYNHELIYNMHKIVGSIWDDYHIKDNRKYKNKSSKILNLYIILLKIDP